MAIKIPSSNIYQINNPKVRDNVVDSIAIEQTVVKPNNEYDVVVRTEKIEKPISELYSGETQNDLDSVFFETINVDSGSRVSVTYNYSYVAIDPSYYEEIKITIPILEKNKYVQSIKDLKDKEGNDNIKYSVYGVVKKGSFIAKVSSGLYKSPKVDTITYSEPNEISEVGAISLPQKQQEYESEENSNKQKAKATVVLNDLTTLGNKKFEIDKNDNWVATFDYVLAQAKVSKFKGSSIADLGTQSVTKEHEGEYEEYVPTGIEITIYGNTIGIDLTDGSITYGSGNKPHSLSGNELLQYSGIVEIEDKIEITGKDDLGTSIKKRVYFKPLTYNVGKGDIIITKDKEAHTIGRNPLHGLYFDTIYYGLFNDGDTHDALLKKEISKHLADNVLNEYENGKETATLRCSISDYYDESGEKKIDIKKNNDKPMSFRLHDQVIPYVFGPNRDDRPMSRYQDGTPKIFEVVGTNMIYDGAVWQELTLLEKIKEKN